MTEPRTTKETRAEDFAAGDKPRVSDGLWSAWSDEANRLLALDSPHTPILSASQVCDVYADRAQLNATITRLTAERDEAIKREKIESQQNDVIAAAARSRIADLEARLAEEKERCAKVCDEKAKATSVTEYAVAYELAADAIRSLPAQKGE